MYIYLYTIRESKLEAREFTCCNCETARSSVCNKEAAGRLAIGNTEGEESSS